MEKEKDMPWIKGQLDWLFSFQSRFQRKKYYQVERKSILNDSGVSSSSRPTEFNHLCSLYASSSDPGCIDLVRLQGASSSHLFPEDAFLWILRAGWTKETSGPIIQFRYSKSILLFLKALLPPNMSAIPQSAVSQFCFLKSMNLHYFCHDWEGQPLLTWIWSCRSPGIDLLLK